MAEVEEAAGSGGGGKDRTEMDRTGSCEDAEIGERLLRQCGTDSAVGVCGRVRGVCFGRLGLGGGGRGTTHDVGIRFTVWAPCVNVFLRRN